MKIGFDVISDLNLSPEESFNWEGKATSLYCIVAGNISSDLRTIHQTLNHLSKLYQGVFYIAGSLEFDNSPDINARISEIYKLCRTIRNVAFMHNHVVIVDGIAIVGVNGWYDTDRVTLENDIHQFEDLAYLSATLERLQLHLDVKKIMIVSHTVPNSQLYFGEEPADINFRLPLTSALDKDSEHKVKNWIFGSYNNTVDTVIDNINYINNSYYKRRPYWAKRVEL